MYKLSVKWLTITAVTSRWLLHHQVSYGSWSWGQMDPRMDRSSKSSGSKNMMVAVLIYYDCVGKWVIMRGKRRFPLDESG